MKFQELKPPRIFLVGAAKFPMHDCGRIELGPDEQVTFVTENGAQYDLARKSWGFYATPSLNARLVDHGLRALLVRNQIDRYFVFLVERGKEGLLDKYIAEESLEFVSWLDSLEPLGKIRNAVLSTQQKCDFCCGTAFETTFTYLEPPKGEVRFPASSSQAYHREIRRCLTCSHFTSVHAMDLSALYSGDYVSSTYKDAEGVKATFNRIVSLDPSKSDNYGRVQRILDFSKNFRMSSGAPVSRLLDVGAGLGVFPFGMKKAGFVCTALDPDPRAAAHLRDVVGVNAVCEDFLQGSALGKFDMVTFNKVLEHVKNPIQMLQKARENLENGGLIYLELPDGEMAAKEGKEREEFFIDHWHVFSASSVAQLIQKAGFVTLAIQRIREPSSKYTLCAFLTFR